MIKSILKLIKNVKYKLKSKYFKNLLNYDVKLI